MDRPSPTSSSSSPSSSLQQPSSPTNLNTPGRRHQRLVMELLPFETEGEFQSWLESAPLMGLWLEFRANCYHLDLDEVDKTRATQMARDALNSGSATYLVYHPDKQGWTLEDHMVRFMVTVMRDAVLQGVWAEAELRSKTLDIAEAVFEVLGFLKAVDEEPSASGSDDSREHPPDYHPPDYSA
ncbi:hypothetical protein MCOR25_007127 [Pyricularia grisea]|nr:hypothetical protein MCOR25_007127 [Pyricularia grisea]